MIDMEDKRVPKQVSKSEKDDQEWITNRSTREIGCSIQLMYQSTQD